MSVAFADYDRRWPWMSLSQTTTCRTFCFTIAATGPSRKTALLAGSWRCADHGKPVASMGTDFRDYDNDGLPDITLTALASETFPIFRNLGKGMFMDATYATQTGGP